MLNPHGGVERAYLGQEFASIGNPLYCAYKRLKRYLSVRHYLEIALQKRLYSYHTAEAIFDAESEAGAEHTSPVCEEQDTPRRQSCAQKAPGGVRHVIAISEMVKRDIIDYYAYPADRISVVFNSVDLDRFHPRMREVHRAEKRAGSASRRLILLLFAGNNFRLKGIETLIRSLALLSLFIVNHMMIYSFCNNIFIV